MMYQDMAPKQVLNCPVFFHDDGWWLKSLRVYSALNFMVGLHYHSLRRTRALFSDSLYGLLFPATF